VTGDKSLIVGLLADLVANFEAWEKPSRPQRLFCRSTTGRMEVSIGGSGYRATINSYMYGDALAIARIAELQARPNWRPPTATRQPHQAACSEKLWDPQAESSRSRRGVSRFGSPTCASYMATRPGTSTFPILRWSVA